MADTKNDFSQSYEHFRFGDEPAVDSFLALAATGVIGASFNLRMLYLAMTESEIFKSKTAFASCALGASGFLCFTSLCFQKSAGATPLIAGLILTSLQYLTLLSSQNENGRGV